MTKSKRKIRNFLLQPLRQTKIGVYVIFLTFAFCFAIAAVYYCELSKFTDFVIKLTDLEDEVQAMLNQSLANIQGYVFGLILIYLVCVIVVSVLTTHSMIG